MKLTTLIKSGLSECLKWPIREGTGAGSFYLRVPNVPATRELVKALRNHRPEAFAYFSKTGHVLGWQWLLGVEDRNLLASSHGTTLKP